MSHTADTSRQALIIMDCQCAVIDNYVRDGEAFLDQARQTIEEAREHDVLVIYVKVAFRPRHPEIATTNRIFRPVRESGLFLRGTNAIAIAPQIAPLPDDIVIEKRRVGSFEGTDLEIILRSQGIGRLVMFGVTTSGVVLSTLRRAADLDFSVTALSDLCVDVDQQVNDVLLGKVFPMQADVLTSQDWIASIGPRGLGPPAN